MYITINSIKKTLGKYVEMTDLYIGIPMIMTFLTMFAFSSHKLFSIVFLLSYWIVLKEIIYDLIFYVDHSELVLHLQNVVH